jgi:Domain of unknown function (DUF4189)
MIEGALMRAVILSALGIASILGQGLFASHGSAEGALSVALPPNVARNGFSYGYSSNQSDAATAAASALKKCQETKDAKKNERLRSLCKVIQNFRDQCVAVAMDPANGTPGVGWAVADDIREAERQALHHCEQTAGPGRAAACVIDHSKCDGKAQPPQ